MTDDSPQPQTDQPTTLRTGLRARREAAVSKLHLDRRVPRMDPPVFVRFKPLPSTTIDRLTKNIEKAKTGSDANAIQNAIGLAEACVGIYEEIDGEQVSVIESDRDGDWPTFDATLARELGIPETTRVADIVRALYLTDGDVISEAGEVTLWSGYARRDGDEDYSGN